MGSSWHVPGPGDHDGSYGLCASKSPDYVFMSDTEFNIIKYILVICDSLLNTIHIQIISFGFFKWSQGNDGITHLNIITCTELNVWPLSEIREMYLVRWGND